MSPEIVTPRLIPRMLRAARLDATLYADVKADPAATSQAVTVTALVGLAHALSAGLRSVILEDGEVVAAFIAALLAEITFWAAASFAIYFVGRYVLGCTITYAQVLRPFGFACVPGLLILIAVLVSVSRVGGVAPGVLALLLLWRVAAGFVAVRQALSLSIMKSVLVLLASVAGGLWMVGVIVRAVWAAYDQIGG